MDWKDALQALKQSGDLPAGESAAEKHSPQPRRTPPRPFRKIEIVVERKGRGGKVATIVCGFTCSDDELASIATRLKQHLGVGGSARGGEILLQGDQRAKVEAWLNEQYPKKSS